MTSKRNILLVFLIVSISQSCSVLKRTSKGKITVNTVKEAQKIILKRRYDTIVLKDGVYQDILFKFPKNSSNIILTSETPGGAIITGKSKIIVSGHKIRIKNLLFYNIKGFKKGDNRVLTLKDADSCRISNCAFIDCGTPYENQIKASGGLVVYLEENAKNNRIDHCYWEGSLGVCLAIGYYPEFEPTNGNPDRVNRNNVIDSCYVNNISEWAELNGKALNGNDPFMIGWNLPPYATNSNTLLHHNLFENISSDSEIISVKMSNTTIAYNTFRNSPKTKYQSPQLFIRAGNNSIVKGNFFLDTGAGITIHGDGHQIFDNYIDSDYIGIHLPGGKVGEYSYPGQNNCYITNNTILNTQYPFMFGKGDWTIKPGEKLNNKIHNNIIFIDHKKLKKTYNKPIIFLDRGFNSAHNVNWKDNTIFTNIKSKHTLSKHKRFLVDYKLNSSNLEFINPDLEIGEDGLYQLNKNSELVRLNRGVRKTQKEISPKNNINTIDMGDKPILPLSQRNNKPLEATDVGPTWIANYSNFKKELIFYWKKWRVEDAIIDHNTASIITPNFNSANSILQFDMSNTEGYTTTYDKENNKYYISCSENRPQIAQISIQDFNENDLKNTQNNATRALIEKWVVSDTNCFDSITVIGNNERVQFLNNRKAPMLLYSNSKKPINLTDGQNIVLKKNQKYTVKLATPHTINKSKKQRKCRVKYIIKPSTKKN